MATREGHRRDWSRLEVEAAVADYFEMLLAELRNEPYNKADHNRSCANSLMADHAAPSN